MNATKIDVTRAAQQIYKDMKMGADSILTLLSKVDEEGIRIEMTAQMEGYLSFADRAEQMLKSVNAKAEEESFLTKMSAKMGMTMNTMKDNTKSHIAEMMIEGSTMGITDVTRILHQVTEGDTSEENCTSVRDLRALAEEIIAFEQKNIETMKAHL